MKRDDVGTVATYRESSIVITEDQIDEIIALTLQDLDAIDAFNNREAFAGLEFQLNRIEQLTLHGRAKLNVLLQHVRGLREVLDADPDKQLQNLVIAVGEDYNLTLSDGAPRFVPSDVENLAKSLGSIEAVLVHHTTTPSWSRGEEYAHDHLFAYLNPKDMWVPSQRNLDRLALIYQTIFEKEFGASTYDKSKNGLRYDGPGVRFVAAVITVFGLEKEFALKPGIRIENQIGDWLRRMERKDSPILTKIEQQHRKRLKALSLKVFRRLSN